MPTSGDDLVISVTIAHASLADSDDDTATFFPEYYANLLPGTRSQCAKIIIRRHSPVISTGSSKPSY